MLTTAPGTTPEEHQMSIYSRQGDAGDTSLADGSRVAKNSARVEAYGALDEAGCAVGFARAAIEDSEIDGLLLFIEQRLMNCASLTARPLRSAAPLGVTVDDDDVHALERAIDRLGDRTGPWSGFVLTAGSEVPSRLHLARAITRRAERRLVALSADEPVEAAVLAFVNRASDALYAATRAESGAVGCTEEPWDPSAPPGF
jgi:cob(I)alamin adenosyltransferase